MQLVVSGLCPGYARSPAAPGELLAALLAPPAGRWPLGYPLVLEVLAWCAARPQLAC